MSSNRKYSKKVEYGDFQTPVNLAMQVCQWLKTKGVSPDVIVEPTCGVGAFLTASIVTFPDVSLILGMEINQPYIEVMRQMPLFQYNERIVIQQADFFRTDWNELSATIQGKVAVIGNFPWVTNTQLSKMNGQNLPAKSNFSGSSGIDAITGKSNFDISEWMLLNTIAWLGKRRGTLAMLCKSAVARKILGSIQQQKITVSSAAMVMIDAKYYFGASVSACLLYCNFDGVSPLNELNEYAHFADETPRCLSIQKGEFIQKGEHQELLGTVAENQQSWRSGVKHDCQAVMELTQTSLGLINGLGEYITIEDERLYPLLKSTDISKGLIHTTNRVVIVTQYTVGEDTVLIEKSFPLTWQYLIRHRDRLNNRQSRIYHGRAPFSIFGVGGYTFAPWKIAISALHKSLGFQLVGPVNGKPVVFDDTVYFLSFDTKADAETTLRLLQSENVQQYLQQIIFWDDKRPIKASILNRIPLSHDEKNEIIPSFSHIS